MKNEVIFTVRAYARAVLES